MFQNLIKVILVTSLILSLISCNVDTMGQQQVQNLINKINIVDDRWVNYKGISENDKSMNQTQFIPYNPDKSYEVSKDTYVSYFNGEDFIKTELYEDTPDIISTVEEADGVILSFNKENKSGMKLN